MIIIENFRQNSMIKNISQNITQANIEKGLYGSFAIKSDIDVRDWRYVGKTDFDKFIKRYEIESEDINGKKSKWTLASRSDENKSGNVTMIVPLIKDKFGSLWTLLQEEARPIDLFRNGKESSLFAFPAGLIGDEVENETALDSAIRELTEETGFVADKIIPLNSRPIPTSPGLTDESTNYYLAYIKCLTPKAKALTDGITKAWWFVPLKNLNKWLEKTEAVGKVANGQTMTALALLKQKTKIRF